MKRLLPKTSVRLMHEISITSALLRQVEQIAAEHNADTVLAIALAIGPLCGIEATLIGRAFAVARNGTIAENASLEIETTAVTVWCGVCARETEVSPTSLRCGGCGDWQVELRSGSELLLKHVELAVSDDVTATR